MGITGPAPASDHVRYLDGLRGVAILMVVMVHVSQFFFLPDRIHAFAAYGVRGVQLFFIVSGLTLMIAHVDRPFDLVSFAARRFFRIAPMFYAGAVLYLILGATTELRFAPHDPKLGEVLATLAFVHDWSLTANNKIVPGGWSIACEAMFYVAFPLLLAAFRAKGGRLWPAVILLYPVAGLTNIAIRRYWPGDPNLVREFAFSFWLCQLPAFATGCWLAFGVGHQRFSRKTAGMVLFLAILLIVIDTQSLGRTNLLISVSLLSLMVWAAGRVRPAILQARAMTFLGEVSFSIYVLHFAVAAVLGLAAPAMQQALGGIPAFLLLFAGTMAISVPLAALTYRFVEKPFIRIGRGIRLPARQLSPA